MRRTYKQAGHEVDNFIRSLILAHYSWMKEYLVRFNLLFAYGPVDKEGQTTAPAILLHGIQAAATVKINSLKGRVIGLADVTIEIDGDQWPDWSPAKKSAVIDQQLYRLEQHRNADGSAQVDDCGRPRITLRKHDFHFGGFAEIALRHGSNAFEVKAVEEAYALIVGPDGQLEWPWAAPQPNRTLNAS